MKPQELRIGNVININGEDILEGIGYGVITDFAQQFKGIKNEYLNTLIFKPTKLTKDIISSFNFIYCKGKYGEYYKHELFELFRIWAYEDYYVIGRKDNEKDETYYITNTKYAHKLQNVFYDLTGEELLFKK